MAHFADTTAVVSSVLEFAERSERTIQKFRCKNGELAGFQIRSITVLGSAYPVSQVYDCSTGDPVLQGTVSVIPGMDLTGGLFSSGCIPDGDPFSITTKFYKVDYV